MNIFQQCSVVSFLLQVPYSYGSYQKEQIIPYYRRNTIPFTSYGKRAYHLSSHCPSVPVGYNYDKNYYFPYKSYKYSYIKYAPNKQEFLSPKDRFHCYVNPTIDAEKSRNVRFLGYVPEARGFTTNHQNTYFSAYDKPFSIYTNTLLSNNRNNYSNIYNPFEMFPNVYSQPLKQMPLQNSQKNTWKGLEHLYPSTAAKLQQSTTKYSKKEMKFQENQINGKQMNVQFMFPSEIVIRSLGPWAQIGDKGEYRSNGTFSIKYQSPGMTNLFNNAPSNIYKGSDLKSYFFSSTDVIPKAKNLTKNKCYANNVLTKSTALSYKKSEIKRNQRKPVYETNKYIKKKLNRRMRMNVENMNKKLRKRVSKRLHKKTKLKEEYKNDINLKYNKTNKTGNKNERQNDIYIENPINNSMIPNGRIGNLRKRTYISYNCQSNDCLANESTTRDNESTSRDNESTTKDNESITSDNESITSDNESTTKDIESIIRDNESIIRDNESTTISNESTTRSARTCTKSTTKYVSRHTRKHVSRSTIKYFTRNTEIYNTRSLTTTVAHHSKYNPFKIGKSTVRTTLIDTSTRREPLEEKGNNYEMSADNKAKIECEQKNKIKCICSIRKVLSDLNDIISSNNESQKLLRSLADYSCGEYTPLKSQFKISADMKPRLISKKPKELLVDEASGPKEITKLTLEELMSRGVPNEGVDFYVFPSTSIDIPCITTDNIQLSPNSADSTKYKWTHGNKKLITEGRITEDLNHRGRLQINGVTMEDSDNYTCTVNYTSPDTEETTSTSFVHTVLVVTEPIIALHTLIHYNAKSKCDQEILEMFELYIPQQLEQILCQNDESTKICNVEIYNPMCITKRSKKPKSHVVKKDVYEIPSLQSKKDSNNEERMEISLNYEIDTGNFWELMPSTNNKTHCSPFCQQKVLLKVIETLRESITEALNYPVVSSLGIVFEPDDLTMSLRLVIACSGGLRLSQGFCVPCPKGFYSVEGSTKCTKCPIGTFQDNIGGKSCEDCPHPFREGCFEMWFTPLMLIIFIAIIIIIILLGCLLVYCCRERITGTKTKRINKQRKEKSGERQSGKKENIFKKLKKKKTKKDDKRLSKKGTASEDAPSLPPEDFSAET